MNCLLSIVEFDKLELWGLYVRTRKVIILEVPVNFKSHMTCYFRHIKGIFEKAGIVVTKENKKSIDQAIHNLVNVEYKNCSRVWREVKQKLTANEDEFISDLKKLLKFPAD